MDPITVVANERYVWFNVLAHKQETAQQLHSFDALGILHFIMREILTKFHDTNDNNYNILRSKFLYCTDYNANVTIFTCLFVSVLKQIHLNNS